MTRFPDLTVAEIVDLVGGHGGSVDAADIFIDGDPVNVLSVEIYHRGDGRLTVDLYHCHNDDDGWGALSIDYEDDDE